MVFTSRGTRAHHQGEADLRKAAGTILPARAQRKLCFGSYSKSLVEKEKAAQVALIDRQVGH
jgi:hypothetical protein